MRFSIFYRSIKFIYICGFYSLSKYCTITNFFIMATARRLTPAEAIRSLQVDEFDNSCDENEDITARSVIQVTLENSDLSDCDSD